MTQSLVSRRSVLVGAGGLFVADALHRTALGQERSELRVAQPWEIKSLQPIDSGYVYSRSGITETLVAVEPDGRLVPGLAESWQASGDGLTWRVRLRLNVVFHDGRPMTVDAAKASYDNLLSKSLYLSKAGVTSVTADGDTLVFTLGKPFGPFPAYLIDNSAPVLAPSAFDDAGDVKALIGTGPYKLREARVPRFLIVERNNAYWGEVGAFETVRIEAVKNGETRGNIAVAGDADLVFNIPAPSISRVENSGAMRVDRLIIPRVHILMLNVGKPQFANQRTRLALNMAINRAGIAASIMRNPDLAATQYFAPPLSQWHFDDMEPHRFDVVAANALLDEAGWTVGSDGIRVKGGARFAGTLRTFPNRPELPVIAEALQAQFKEIGFDLSISVGEWTAIYEGQKDGTLDLGLSSRNLIFVPDPIATVATDFTLDEPIYDAVGTTNWKNQAIRNHVADYYVTSSPEEQAHLRREIAEIIHEEVPLLPVVWYEQIIAVNTRIDGFISDPFEQRYFLEKITLS
jgi:peptide/nickel transport system substrate-binding protein